MSDPTAPPPARALAALGPDPFGLELVPGWIGNAHREDVDTAFADGLSARERGIPKDANPWPTSSTLYSVWSAAWHIAGTSSAIPRRVYRRHRELSGLVTLPRPSPGRVRLRRSHASRWRD